MTKFQKIKAGVNDITTTIATALTIARLGREGVGKEGNLTGINVGLEMYPALPVAVIGLSIWGLSKINLARWFVFLFGLIVLVIVGVVFSCVLVYAIHLRDWGVAVFAYSYMALPVAYVLNFWALLFLCAAISVLARVGGVVVECLLPVLCIGECWGWRGLSGFGYIGGFACYLWKAEA